MASLPKGLRRLWVALLLVLGLTALPAIASLFVGDELAGLLPGPAAVLADECENTTCP